MQKHIQNIHEKVIINFAKAFNSKVHKKNVHEIEKISTTANAYESINDIIESTILRSAYWKCP